MRDEESQNATYESPKERKHEHDTREFTGFVPQQQKSFLLSRSEVTIFLFLGTTALHVPLLQEL